MSAKGKDPAVLLGTIQAKILLRVAILRRWRAMCFRSTTQVTNNNSLLTGLGLIASRRGGASRRKTAREKAVN